MANSVLSQCRILIVDDEPMNIALMTRILKRAGYVNMQGVTDSREVLDIGRTWDPDLILLDLHMPNINGLTLLRALRASTSAADFTPVLILTADVDRAVLKQALQAGASDYVTKPIDVDEVLLRVRNLLAIRMSHESLKNSNVALANALRQRERVEEQRAEHRKVRARAISAIIERGPNMVFQPIIELATNRVVGVEALARFGGGRTPDQWFAEATELGLGTELEVSAVRAALQHFDALEIDQFMAVNASPGVMLASPLHDVLRELGRGRVILEITEHQPVHNYDDLRAVRSRLRRDGIRVAVDDAGAGYASLHHILKLAPDVIKLDIALTRGIDRDPVKRALAASLVMFAFESEAIVTAEGIETAAEFEALRALDVPWGQGFFIARPGPLAARTTPPARGRLSHT